MKIFVATYEDSGGSPYQNIFKTKEDAKIWLKKQYDRDFDDVTNKSFREWCEYGAWTGKIRSYNI